MNSELNAFPIVLQHGLSHDSHVDIGLTKREYFVAKALQGLCANATWSENLTTDDWHEYTDRLTSASVEIADKLLVELENNKQ